MAHEWAEELHLLACEHHGTVPGAGRVILSREQMAAGERATSRLPYIGEIRSAGEGRWMQYNGESWEPRSVHPGVAKAFEDKEPMTWFEKRFVSVTMNSVSLENIAASFNIPIDLLRDDSDD